MEKTHCVCSGSSRERVLERREVEKRFLRRSKYWFMNQEWTARDFVSNQSLENTGILCVFRVFQTEELGQKTRCPPKMNEAVFTAGKGSGSRLPQPFCL